MDAHLSGTDRYDADPDSRDLSPDKSYTPTSAYNDQRTLRYAAYFACYFDE